MVNQFTCRQYRDDYPQLFEAWVMAGKTPEAFAKECGVSFNTLLDWALINPEFKAAMAKAETIQPVYSQSKAGRPAGGQSGNYYVINSILRSHDTRCPGYHIKASMENQWVIGRCSGCGHIIERYARTPKRKRKKLWEALQDD